MITDVSYKYMESVQQHLDIGFDIRQLTGYQGVFFGVYDRKTSHTAINIDINSLSLNEPISTLMTDDPTYAHYLASTFELLWERSIPATQRIEELLKEGAPHS